MRNLALRIFRRREAIICGSDADLGECTAWAVSTREISAVAGLTVTFRPCGPHGPRHRLIPMPQISIKSKDVDVGNRHSDRRGASGEVRLIEAGARVFDLGHVLVGPPEQDVDRVAKGLAEPSRKVLRQSSVGQTSRRARTRTITTRRSKGRSATIRW